MADNRKAIAATRGSSSQPYPILKWAGGKTQLLPSLAAYLPDRFDRYYEPFVGGGAMFFYLLNTRQSLRGFLSDYNEELINCYCAVRDNVEAVIRQLKKHRNDREYYYRLRAQDPKSLADAERAARLIFLNKTCFNGLYRVNSRGQFNVPFGDYKNPRTCDEVNLRAVSQALQTIKIQSSHFGDALKSARRGDFVYFDPPYQPLSATANFTSYTSRCFGENDQRQLADVVRQLAKRSCKIMLSNSDNDFIRELYRGFRIETVWATRAINCKGDRRGRVSELVILNY